MEQQRGLLLLLLGLQLLLMGALLCPNHHLHGFTSSLRFLTQDKPEGGEELPFVVQVSSPGTPRQDVYSNISQIHRVDIRREDLPNCPIVSPYISKLVGGLLCPQPHFGLWGAGFRGWGSEPGSRSCGLGAGSDGERVGYLLLNQGITPRLSVIKPSLTLKVYEGQEYWEGLS